MEKSLSNGFLEMSQSEIECVEGGRNYLALCIAVGTVLTVEILKKSIFVI